MCTVCGCSDGGQAQIHAHDHSHAHGHDHSHEHAHDHDHDHHHDHTHDHAGDDPGGTHHYGQGPARAHAPGLSQARMVEIEENILGKNNEYAMANRRRLRAAGTLALNLVSSPGSGKTTLLAQTMQDLSGEMPLAVIEGDQQTDNDAARIRATGVPALQVNTGKGCHLDGHMIGHALDALPPPEDGILFIENVGNLVCPAAFDLGEDHKVVILSVTEGEDKPLKYPDMFDAAALMLLNKIDLLPHLDFDVAQCVANARRVNPRIRVLQVSATTGEGMPAWYQWIRASQAMARVGQ